MLATIPKRYILGLGIVCIVVFASIPSFYFYGKYQEAQLRLKDPTAAAKEDSKHLMAIVGKLIELPQGEEPTVAVVSDISKLNGQAFFANAKNGDKVLIFTNARKAILFRPDTQKIIEVGPVNIGATASASAQTAAAKTYTVILRNGTDIVGLTKKMEDVIRSKITNLTVTDRQNAKKRTYATSMLVDVTGTQGVFAKQAADALGIAVAPMPKDESSASADFLIIVGTDKK